MEGLEKTSLGEREVILKFLVRKQNVLSGFAKVGTRKAVTISKINGCICAEIKEGCMVHPVVYLGAVGAKASRARLIEACLEGLSLSGCDEEKVRDAVYAQIEENIPDRPSKHYKKSAAFRVVDRILDGLRRNNRRRGGGLNDRNKKSDLKYVGKSYIREDDYDKARGKTQYTCDRQIAGMLYAKLVLSEKANAEISISTEKASRVPGIHAVFTHANVPKITYNPHNWSACLEFPLDQYILSERARYVGDHLALVVGETKAAVEEAVSLVEITYKEEAPVIGLDAARKTEGMLAFEKEVSCGDYGALAEESKEELTVVRTNGSTQKIHHSAIEPHIALSEIDENGNLVLWTPCQTVYQVRYHISHLLGISYSKVRVIKAVMGGSFGGKGQTVVEPACAFATWILKRPVMLYMDRQDAVMGTRSRNASETCVETAVTRDGIIRGRRIDTDFDGGAYYTNASSVAMAYCKKLFRMYRVENQTCHVRTFYTNTISGGACRGYGSPQAHAVTEVNLDQTANAIGMDPCEFRLKNVVHPMDEDPTGGTNLGNARIEECIRKGMEAFSWKEKREHIREKDTKRYAYGVGMACGAHGNGYKGAYPEFTNVRMTVHSDGSVEVQIGIHEQGCGTVMTRGSASPCGCAASST